MLIGPVVFYGHESWTLFGMGRTLTLHAAVFEWCELQSFFGYGELDILTVAKTGRIRWLGHIMRIPDTCPTNKVLTSDPPGTRRRGTQ